MENTLESLSKIEAYLQDKEETELPDGEKILDFKKFVESHLAFARTYVGKSRVSGYFDRLVEVVKIIHKKELAKQKNKR